MAFSIDPSNLIGNAIQGAIGAPVLIGLPSSQAPVPNFVIGIMPQEDSASSVTLPSFQLTAGDLFMKSAVNGGTFKLTLAASENPDLPSTWVSTLATAIQALASIANSIANFGAVLPNLSGITSNYALSQIRTLHAIKNNTQPVLLLNSFISLGSISQSSPYLSSNWFIESIDVGHDEADDGVIANITLRELLTKRNASLTNPTSIVTNFANEVIGPGVGSSIANLI